MLLLLPSYVELGTLVGYQEWCDLSHDCDGQICKVGFLDGAQKLLKLHIYGFESCDCVNERMLWLADKLCNVFTKFFNLICLMSS